MKLIRYGPSGDENPGMIDDDGNIRDLREEIADISGDALLPRSLERLKKLDVSTLPRVSGDPRIGACVGRVGKFICIGLNYSDHAAEAGMKVPGEPVVFMKATSAVCGPNDGVVIPRGSSKTDWEVELGVVIGRAAKYVSPESALSHVAGYCVINDISERAFQLEGTGQWTKGKGADTFGPIGPWLVTADEISNPQNLDMWLEVNGRRFQDGNTRTMVFGVAYLVSYLSQYMSLQPGDIISTGTPPGVGMGQRPPIYLAPGDKIVLGIHGLGVQGQSVVADTSENSQHATTSREARE
jgi:2-keto-4-pentenoate hydratase/2-oxohepta-3-ene-1,7-dioic acid hydratase in catechol pathway